MSGGRPSKNNAEYFPHYSNLRNHRKVRAVRTKFGQALGLAFWCLILEWLIEHDGLEFEYSEIEVEMLAAELDISAAEIRGMVDYCVKIEMLFLTESNFLYSESLNDKLAPLFEKRQRERERSRDRQRRENGQFKIQEAQTEGVSAAETPQSKVKESKENKSIEKEEKNKEKKKAQKPTAFDPYVYEFSSFKSKDFIDAWHSFCDHRKEKKKTLTLRAVRIIEGELNKVTEAVAIALLKKGVAQDWTGIEAKWIKESDQNEINKDAAASQKLTLQFIAGVPVPDQLLEERERRRKQFESAKMVGDFYVPSPNSFSADNSIFHKREGGFDELRDNVGDIIKRLYWFLRTINNNRNGTLPGIAYLPHKSGLFEYRIKQWLNVTTYSAIESQIVILATYDEPIACEMINQAIQTNRHHVEELSDETAARCLEFFGPRDEIDNEKLASGGYELNSCAWCELKRRRFMMEEILKENPARDVENMTFPEYYSKYHYAFGAWDKIEPWEWEKLHKEVVIPTSSPAALETPRRRYLNDSDLNGASKGKIEKSFEVTTRAAAALRALRESHDDNYINPNTYV